MTRLSSAPAALAAGAFAMAVPAVASANTGVGYLTAASPMLVWGLVPIILVEAVVLAKTLELAAGRAFMVSLEANFWSTILGIFIGFAIDMVLVSWTGTGGWEPTKAATSEMLVPMFAITWCLEYFAVARLARDKGRRRVFQATGWANLISYVGMFAAAWVFLPAHASFALRWAVDEGATNGVSTRDAVSEFWDKNGRLPVSAQELPDGISAFPHDVVTLEPSARVSVRLSPPGLPELDGKHFVLTPIVPDSKDKPLEWKCSSPDISDRYVPMPCRSGR